MTQSSSSLHANAALGALSELLAHEFTATTCQRGKSYLRRGAVIEMWEDNNTVAGLVEGSEADPYTATLTYDGLHWYSECSCPVEFDCKHAFALGSAWLQECLDAYNGLAIGALPASPTAKVKKQSFREKWSTALAAKIGRPLTDKENRLLGKLSSLFNEYRSSGQLTRYTLHRHGFAADDTLTYDRSSWQPAFPGWWDYRSQPQDPWQLWQYVALHWEQEGRAIPEAFAPMTDTRAIRTQLDQRLLQQELDAWQQATSPQISSPTFGDRGTTRRDLATTYRDLRAVLDTHGSAHLEALPATANKPWRIPTKRWLDELLHSTLAQFDRLPEPARFLALELRLLAEDGYSNPFTAGQIPSEFLDYLLGNPRTADAFFLSNGDTFKIEEHPLEIHAQALPHDPSRLELNLLTPDGALIDTFASPIAFTPTPLYLHAGRVWPGPPPLPNRRLPISALENTAIATQLNAMRVHFPADLAAKFVKVELRPLIRCWTDDPPLDSRASPEFCLQLFARSESPACEQHFENINGWTWTDQGRLPPPKADTPHYHFDLTDAQAIVSSLPNLKLSYPSSGQAWMRAASPAFLDDFIAWHANLPPGTHLEVSPDLRGLIDGPIRTRLATAIQPAESSGQDWFDITVELKPDDVTLTDEELRLLLKANGKWVRLPQRGWQRLSLEETVASPVATTLEHLGLTADPAAFLKAREKPETHRFHALQLADVPLDDKALAARLRQRASTLRAMPPPPLPTDLTATLRPYQLEGYHYLAHLTTHGLGGILADDMGLGKTVQALAWLLWLRDRRPTRKKPLPFRVLIVCPKSVVPNWQNEAARFTPSLLTSRITPRQPPPDDPTLLVINYTQLRLNADPLKAVEWDAVILDEGQNIKNPASATARVARELRTRQRLVLTGTPIENRVLDLWSLLAFAQPGLLGTQASFQRTYRDKDDPVGTRARLATRVRPFLLRRAKSEVARDLPARTEEDIFCELDGPQRKLYDAELKRARQMLTQVKSKRQFDAARFNILQSLLRLRQICCDPRLVGATVKNTAASAKLEALLERLEPLVAEGHRVLVFSQFVTMLELIRDELTRRDIDHLLLTGQTENRQDLVDTFQSPSGPPVFLLSLKAAGSGLNLTAASYVVLYDPWWNPAVEAQAIDRTHRIGQTSNVLAYRLIAQNTIEEKIRALQREKAALAAAIVKEENVATVMDLDTLRQVLG